MNYLINLLLLSCFILTSITSLFSENKPPFNPESKSYLHNMTDEKEILKRYASYNHWANQQMITWFQDVSEETMKQEVNSSFPSLYLTLLHIWDAESGWLNTVLNEPWGTSPSNTFNGSMQGLYAGLLATSASFESAIHALNEENFLSHPENGKGTRLDDIVLHLFNHSTFHRGQLITIGRQVGLSNPPRTDYIYYVRQKTHKN